MTRQSLAIALLLWALTACTLSIPDSVATPTAQPAITASATQRPRQTASPTPTVIIPPPTASPTIAETPPTAAATAPPTVTSRPTETPGPFEYVIQEDDTLYYIIQLPQHGYSYEPAVAQAVVALNDNISSIDILPPVGSVILIPRPTATSIPIGAQATQALLATVGLEDISGAILASGAVVGCYDVEAGDSLVGIAQEYDTTLEVLSQLNPDLNWFGCEFTERSGGLDCNPTIQIGQCIRVPQPTPLPSKTPTPSGNETATPTPTYMAPRLLYPTDGAVIPPGQLILQWIGLSGLRDGDEYLIELQDRTAGRLENQTTTSNVLVLPDSFVPQDGQTHTILWRVSAARPNRDGDYAYAGAQGSWRIFEWMSR